MTAADIWQEFCELLKPAAGVLTRPAMAGDDRHQINGVRYLAGLLDSGLDLWLHGADPDRPRLFTVYNPWKGWSLENPDALYQRTRLRGDATYRISGRRGSAPYLGFELSHGFWSYSKPVKIHRSLASRNLAVAANGRFEIILSAQPQPGNWLQLEPDTEWLHIRQFLHDWVEDELAEIHIERTDRDPGPPDFNADQMRARLREVAWFVEEEARLWADYCLHMREVQGVNVMPRPTLPGGSPDDPTKESGAPENEYSQGYYRLADDEALLVEFDPPRAAYWNIQLGTMWYEPLDFGQRLQSYNDRQAFVGADGIFRTVIAHRDPGVPNWLDTGGFREGVMLCRFQFPETPAPQPQTRVVRFDSLAQVLPVDTPHVDERSRRAELERRRQGLSRRFR